MSADDENSSELNLHLPPLRTLLAPLVPPEVRVRTVEVLLVALKDHSRSEGDSLRLLCREILDVLSGPGGEIAAAASNGRAHTRGFRHVCKPCLRVFLPPAFPSRLFFSLL